MHTHTEVVVILNEVIETLNERQSGYRLAAGNVKDLEVAGFFNDCMSQSTRFISELLPFSDESSPKNIGKGPLGSLFQAWMQLKERIAGYDTGSIIRDCVTGEEAAIKVYESALTDEELPFEVRTILEKQYGELKAAKERLKVFREQKD